MTVPLAALALGTALSLGLVSAATAQDLPYEVMRAEQAIDVPAGQAITVSFDAPYTDLSISDPEIADISSLDDTTLYLLGKRVGTVTLTVIHDREALDLEHFSVVVYRDIAPMQAFLEQTGGKLSLERTGTAVTVSGCVAGDRQQRALDGIMAQLSDWGYMTLTDVGGC